MAEPAKPRRLSFKSYLQLIHNAVGANLFRNLYVHTEEKGDFDALGDGANSCAFFVSAVLVLFKKISDIHGTVQATVEDLRQTGWIEVEAARAGDVLVWEARPFDDGPHQHIGFSIGNGRAISTSCTQKTPVEHDEQFGAEHRKITRIFRLESWE